ncbi:MAG: hypothetical protein CBB82_05480 [Betaproteobacteria bacterium TMED22]|nr:MAG: hypothetical protein CBB82_05480 [Betaproteobacteria bacterium TMED22]
MLDIRFDNVTIIDGTGEPGFLASLGVKDGRIAEIGTVEALAIETIDCSGLCLMPGIVDNHTHYDAQVTWDPYCNPSPALGVTTLVMGNCGFTIAPCHPSDRDITMRNLTQVEGMSIDALQSGIDWSFETFPEYLDMLEGRGVAPNVSCFVGHSSVRTYVLQEDASRRAATSKEVESMRAIVIEAMEAGACGFATTRYPGHNGENGIPMPSRLADEAEMMSLSSALKDLGRGVLMMTKSFDMAISDIEKLSAAAERPYLIAALLHSHLVPNKTFSDLSAIREAQARGNRLYGAVSPCPLTMDFSFWSPYPLEGFSCWKPMMSLNADAYKASLADPVFRKSFMDELNDGEVKVFSGQWDKIHVAQVGNPDNLVFEGKSIAVLADEAKKPPFDFMLDLALEENLETMFTATIMNSDEDAVGRMMHDENAIISLSDAGAHLTFLCDAGFGLHVLGHWVRDKGILSLERAVHKLTLEPARLFGIKNRGYIDKGAWADLLLFDPKTVNRGPSHRLHDLPAGASRLTTPPIGVHGVWVNGRQVANGKGVLPQAPLAGQVIREYDSF